ncbi:hypothetical protein LWI29_026869 [Acer saccharum]|uniref:Uncharacterized protein n=1 Tax=Acer saccharum TaxID=4024 RepID=A0AA39VYB9_ACESA|nr:hypothetical protein LWI29_026869 [Acer saccharum]
MATLASRNVDCCLIPESPFYLEAPGGIFEFIGTEGAGMRISKDKGTDASGNKLLHDGLWISQKNKGTLCRKAKDGYKSEVYRSEDRHTLSMQFLAIHLIMFIFEEIRRHGLKVAMAGIPKTIDNAFQL